MNKETMVAVELIEDFKGVCANDYKDTYEYVIDGMWERDYFSSWLESCSDYPCLEEIEDFCREVYEMIELYVNWYEEQHCKE